jgi:NAD-dependent deacetylase
MEFAGLFSDTLLARCLRARRIVVSTGAGVSAESGVATFRDPGGLWAKFRPEELASVDAFLANPDLVCEWYSWRREVIASVQPNPGHYALAAWEAMVPDFTLITQNVDNLHRRAGSARVIELHGNIERSRCMDCRRMAAPEETGPGEAAPGEAASGEAAPPVSVPRCACGGMLRPDVVWFGEMLPQEAVREAWEAAGRADVFFSVGTSGEVYPAAQLPAVAREGGAYTVEINPRPSAVARHMHEMLEGPSGVILPALVEAFRRQQQCA